MRVEDPCIFFQESPQPNTTMITAQISKSEFDKLVHYMATCWTRNMPEALDTLVEEIAR